MAGPLDLLQEAAPTHIKRTLMRVVSLFVRNLINNGWWGVYIGVDPLTRSLCL